MKKSGQEFLVGELVFQEVLLGHKTEIPLLKLLETQEIRL